MKQTIIYFKQQDNRKKEIAFLELLKNKIVNVKHINENYPIPEKYFDEYIEVSKIIKALKVDSKLSVSKITKTIEVLKTLPKWIKVAEDISKVSVDFTIERNNEIHFVEFHEKQHSRLPDSRMKHIFCSKGERYDIPRFAQRLLKDIWRWQYLPNYKIVWWDWFEVNKGTFSVPNLFKSESMEFYIKDKFSFSTLFPK